MSTDLSRKATLLVWLTGVFGLVALLGLPLTLGTGALLLFAGSVPPAILLILSREPAPVGAEVLHRTEMSRRA